MGKNYALLILFVAAIATAQLPNWTWAHGYTAYTGENNYSAVDHAGNVFLAAGFNTPTMQAGTTMLTNASPGSPDISIIKHNRDGEVVFAKREGGPGHDAITAISTDPSGNLYVAGAVTGEVQFGTHTVNEGGPFINRPFLARYDQNGTVTLAIIPADGNFTIESIAADSAGSIFFAGLYFGPQLVFGSTVLINQNYDETGGNGVVYLAKLNPDGSLDWAKGTQRSVDTIFANLPSEIALDGQGNVYLGGRFHSQSITFTDITLTKPLGNSPNFFMVQYNINGDAVWAKTCDSALPNNMVFAVTADAQGYSYFGGLYTGVMTFDGTLHMASSGSKGFLTKIGPNGSVEWFRTIDASGYSNVDDLQVHDDGAVFASGTFFGNYVNFGGSNQAVAIGNGNLFVAKFNDQGSPGWSRLAGPLDVNQRVDLDMYAPNEFYVSSGFYAPEIQFGAITLTRNEVNVNNFIAKLFYEPLSIGDHGHAGISAYPNPTAGQVILSDASGFDNYQVFDLYGRMVGSGHPESIDITPLSAGTYLMKLSGIKSALLKIVKQ